MSTDINGWLTVGTHDRNQLISLALLFLWQGEFLVIKRTTPFIRGLHDNTKNVHILPNLKDFSACFPLKKKMLYFIVGCFGCHWFLTVF